MANMAIDLIYSYCFQFKTLPKSSSSDFGNVLNWGLARPQKHGVFHVFAGKQYHL
jgi:hypothetical protein